MCVKHWKTAVFLLCLSKKWNWENSVFDSAIAQETQDIISTSIRRHYYIVGVVYTSYRRWNKVVCVLGDWKKECFAPNSQKTCIISALIWMAAWKKKYHCGIQVTHWKQLFVWGALLFVKIISPNLFGFIKAILTSKIKISYYYFGKDSQ